MDTTGEESSNTDFNREETITRILELQKTVLKNNRSIDRNSAIHQRTHKVFKKAIIYAFLGRKLSRSLSVLIKAVNEQKRPYFGTELADVLEAVSRKIMGYKRWLLIIGVMAALPGLISIFLLYQQYDVAKQSKIKAIEDLRNSNRMDLLYTIFHTTEKNEEGQLTTPYFSSNNRRNAVMELIRWDAERIEIVDISFAPLNNVDFSPIPGEEPYYFRHTDFGNSFFENASFENCLFESVLFSDAMLYDTNFRNCRFKDVFFDNARIVGADFTGAVFVLCDFTGALFDETTLWPDGFDPVEFGAIPFAESNEE